MRQAGTPAPAGTWARFPQADTAPWGFPILSASQLPGSLGTSVTAPHRPPGRALSHCPLLWVCPGSFRGCRSPTGQHPLLHQAPRHVGPGSTVSKPPFGSRRRQQSWGGGSWGSVSPAPAQRAPFRWVPAGPVEAASQSQALPPQGAAVPAARDSDSGSPVGAESAHTPPGIPSPPPRGWAVPGAQTGCRRGLEARRPGAGEVSRPSLGSAQVSVGLSCSPASRGLREDHNHVPEGLPGLLGEG